MLQMIDHPLQVHKLLLQISRAFHVGSLLLCGESRTEDNQLEGWTLWGRGAKWHGR